MAHRSPTYTLAALSQHAAHHAAAAPRPPCCLAALPDFPQVLDATGSAARPFFGTHTHTHAHTHKPTPMSVRVVTCELVYSRRAIFETVGLARARCCVANLTRVPPVPRGALSLANKTHTVTLFPSFSNTPCRMRRLLPRRRAGSTSLSGSRSTCLSTRKGSRRSALASTPRASPR